jgi:hypothetical protein
MSTKLYPQGMRSYNNVSLPQFPLTGSKMIAEGSWKPTGAYSYPIAITSGNIRPLTNKDPTNAFVQKYGLPRPLKWQYRKGTVTHPYITVINPDKPNEYIEVSRVSHSSKIHSLIGQTIDQPGRFSVKHNPPTEKNGTIQLNKDCQKCYGIGLVSSFAPERFLTNNPEPCVTNPKLCCNQESFAKKAVIYANTNLPQNYYTTHYQYLQNRCKTYQQKAFNFVGPLGINGKAKPGTPLASTNTYIANCYPNVDELVYSQANIANRIFLLLKSQSGILTEQDIENYYNTQISNLYQMTQYLNSIEGDRERALMIYFNFINNPYVGIPINGPSNPRGCKTVVYKPSNPQFAVEGGVSSSTKILKLTTDTISTNIASIKGGVENPFIYKNKNTTCPNSTNTYMRYYRKCQTNSSSEKIRTRALSKLGNIGGNVNGSFVAEAGMTNSFN